MVLEERKTAPEPREPAGDPAEDEAPRAPLDPPEAFPALLEQGLAFLDGEAQGGPPGGAAPRDAAIAVLERAFALRQDDPDVLHALGLAYGARALEGLRANGHDFADPGRTAVEANLQKAIFAYSRAAEVDPKCVEALNNLAALHALRGDRPLAIEALKRSLQAFPDQPRVRERLEELGAF
jgi:tetratricopeptide (TPR) repeat protein